MKTSLFSQSLFAMSLEKAIETTAEAGYEAIEIACVHPHLEQADTVQQTESRARRLAGCVRAAGLRVSALSLFGELTNPRTREAELSRVLGFTRLCPVFDTSLVKLTPGGPSSAAAGEATWDCMARALDVLIPEAERSHLRLAFETHLRQITDTLAGSLRLMRIVPVPAVGLTVDYCNLLFSGESAPEAATTLLPYTYHTHIKNGYVDSTGGWHFGPLDEGMTDYGTVLRILAAAAYDGYLSVECLGKDPRETPRRTVMRDLEILRRYLDSIPLPDGPQTRE